MTMSAPALARPMAIPRPNPPLPPVTIATLPCRSNSSIMFSFARDLQAYSPLDNCCTSRSIHPRCTHLARDAWEYTIANASALWRRETHNMLTSEIDGYLTYYDI